MTKKQRKSPVRLPDDTQKEIVEKYLRSDGGSEDAEVIATDYSITVQTLMKWVKKWRSAVETATSSTDSVYPDKRPKPDPRVAEALQFLRLGRKAHIDAIRKGRSGSPTKFELLALLALEALETAP